MVKKEIITDLAMKLDQKHKSDVQELEKLANIQKENAKSINQVCLMMEKENEKLQKENEIMKKENEELQGEKEKLEQQFTKLQDGTKKLSNELKEHEEVLAEITTSHARHIKLLVGKIEINASEYDEETEKLKQNVRCLEKDLDKVVLELKTKDSELKSVKQDIESMRQKVLPNNPNATLEDIKQEVGKLAEKKELLGKIEDMKKNKAKLESSIKSLKKDQSLIEFELRSEQAKTTRITGKRKMESLYFAAATPEKRHQIITSISLPQSTNILRTSSTNEGVALSLSIYSKSQNSHRKTKSTSQGLLCSLQRYSWRP